MNNVSRKHIKEFSFLFTGQRPDVGPSQETLGNHPENGEARTAGKRFLCNHEISQASGSREAKGKLEGMVHGELTLTSLNISSPNPSQHQSLFQRVNSSHEVAKVLEFQL